MADEKLFHVGVKGLIKNSEGKLLLVKTTTWRGANKAHWDIPGGRIQKGQTAQDTLIREIEEETGIKEISNIIFFTAVISNIEIPFNEVEKLGLLLMIYEASVPANSKVTLSEEHTAYEWVSPKEAAKSLAFKYPKEFTDKLG